MQGLPIWLTAIERDSPLKILVDTTMVYVGASASSGDEIVGGLTVGRNGSSMSGGDGV